MKSAEQILEKVTGVILDHQGHVKQPISEESHLVKDIGLNSFDLIVLACEFEEVFSIQVPDQIIDRFQTVGDIVDYITLEKCNQCKSSPLGMGGISQPKMKGGILVDKIPVALECAVINDEDEMPTIVNTNTGAILLTNKVGLAVLKLCDSNNSVTEISEQIAAQFNAEIETVRKDVSEFIAQADKEGIIEFLGEQDV